MAGTAPDVSPGPEALRRQARALGCRTSRPQHRPMLADRLGVAGHRDGTVSASAPGGAAVAVEMAPAFLIAPGGYSILAITGISACNSGPRGPGSVPSGWRAAYGTVRLRPWGLQGGAQIGNRPLWQDCIRRPEALCGH